MQNWLNKKIDTDYGSLSYTDIGSGIAVVLLHGFGEDSTIWEQQVNYLKPHCRLLVPDLPGTGSSTYTAQNELSIEAMAKAVEAILVHEQIDKCIMMGHSMGGYITLAFAEKYPYRLLKMALIHSTAYADSDEKKNNRLKSMGLIAEYGSQAFLKTTIPNLFGAACKRESPEIINQLIQKSAAFSKESLQAYTKAMMLRPDRTNILEQTKIPILFIAGTEDSAVPLTDIQIQAELPTKKYLYILNGVGHMGMLEATDLVNQYLLQFIHS